MSRGGGDALLRESPTQGLRGVSPSRRSAIIRSPQRNGVLECFGIRIMKSVPMRASRSGGRQVQPRRRRHCYQCHNGQFQTVVGHRDFPHERRRTWRRRSNEGALVNLVFDGSGFFGHRCRGRRGSDSAQRQPRRFALIPKIKSGELLVSPYPGARCAISSGRVWLGYPQVQSRKMLSSVRGGPFWTPITPPTGSFFHAKSQAFHPEVIVAYVAEQPALPLSAARWLGSAAASA